MRRGLKFVPLALLLAVVVELAVFVGVGRALGFGLAVLLVFAASLLGLVLLRREGMRAWRGFRAAASAGQPPGGQVTDGLVGLGGALLLAAPGLVSGLIGLLLLVPPVRRLARAGVRRATERRVSSMVAGDLFGPRTVRVRQGAPQPTPQPQPPVVVDGGRAIEGEIIEPGRQ
ncbi:FxsA family protein [Micromonospora sp. NPDC049044]|uniref:FxsA family protein n=1 Tax=unclassified Micromonospora TaxID=2617518 RepID=UPI0033E8D7C8